MPPLDPIPEFDLYAELNVDAYADAVRSSGRGAPACDPYTRTGR